MKRIIQSQISLFSSTSKVSVPIQICYTDDEVEITINYNGAKYCATGKDNLWVDAFADLQRKLPSDIQLACCMTCRHGNMCPYGNSENELYCTKGLKVENEDDLCDLFDAYLTNDPNILLKVSSFNYCDNFVYQSDDYYTYNDYLYQLNKKKRTFK